MCKRNLTSTGSTVNMKKNILGVKVDDVSLDEVLKIVDGWLVNKGKHYIVTPNPEIVMMAQKDAELKNIINNADLGIPDGIGLKLAGDIVCNTPGIDLMERIIELAQDKGFTTGFLGGRDNVAKKVVECLSKIYPKLKITFAESGGEVDENGRLLKLFKILKCDFLFVAFGPPKQEKWIAKNLDKIPVKVAMGVGGSFDVISGMVPRAPIFIRKLGFEWLFRLMLQPWRIKRQLKLLKFVWLLTKRK